REHGETLSVFATLDDYRALRAGSECALYKIHGSATVAASMVDTSSQKLRGLPLEVRARIAEIARDFHLLFVGVSGADRAFRRDSFGIADELPHSRGITWLVAGDGSVPEPVERLLRAAGERGATVEGRLPEFLGELGAALQPGEEAQPREQELANAKARRVVAEWLRDPAVRPPACAVDLSPLLSRPA